MSEEGVSKESTKEEVDALVTYTSILQEHDVVRKQRQARVELLKEMAKPSLNDGAGPHGVIAYISQASLVPSDIPVLGNMLLRVGDVNTLNLILHSPGGEGTIVEKFVELCRAQCKRFRVLVPNSAKSAATMIALGADEIVMGPPAELGPIDAQVDIVVGGMRQLISAQSFIDARDKLLELYAKQVHDGEDTGATLQMIVTLDLPFIAHCERLMAFGREVGRKLLRRYMFNRKKDKAKKAKRAVDKLSSVNLFKVHGRRVDGSYARRELGLNVSLRSNTDEFWKKIWRYYTRVEVASSRSGIPTLVESEHELLVGIPRT